MKKEKIEDLKTFVRYYTSADFKKFKELTFLKIRKAMTWIWIFLVFSLIISLTQINKTLKVGLICLLWVLSAILIAFGDYKSGIHKHWDRVRRGIIKPKYLKKG